MEQIDEKITELPLQSFDSEPDDENEEIFKWLSIAVFLIWVISFLFI